MNKKLLLVLLGCISTAAYCSHSPPNRTTTTITITSSVPVDRVSRAKFPNVNGRLIDELAFVNKIVNASIIYEDDQSHYGDPDFWVMDPKDGKGDCEDYVLTKISMIEHIQEADTANTNPLEAVDDVVGYKIVGVIVHFKDDFGNWQIDGHAILAVRLPDRSVAYLDLNNEELMTRQELMKGSGGFYYQFVDWTA